MGYCVELWDQFYILFRLAESQQLYTYYWTTQDQVMSLRSALKSPMLFNCCLTQTMLSQTCRSAVWGTAWVRLLPHSLFPMSSTGEDMVFWSLGVQTWAVWCQFSSGPEQALACFIYSYRNRQLHLTLPGCRGEEDELWVFSLRGRGCSLLPICSVAKTTFCFNRRLQVSPGICARMVALRNNMPFLPAYIRFFLPTCRIYWRNYHDLTAPLKQCLFTLHLGSHAVTTWIKVCFHVRQATYCF